MRHASERVSPWSGDGLVVRSVHGALVRLRAGVAMWFLSWVPYGIILGLTGVWLTLAWTFEVLLGIVGIALAGTEFGRAAKENGWRGAPRVAWHTLIHGQDPVSPAVVPPAGDVT